MTTLAINARNSNAWKALDRLLKSPSGLIGFILTIGLVLMALLAPILRPFDPATARLRG